MGCGASNEAAEQSPAAGSSSSNSHKSSADQSGETEKPTTSSPSSSPRQHHHHNHNHPSSKEEYGSESNSNNNQTTGENAASVHPSLTNHTNNAMSQSRSVQPPPTVMKRDADGNIIVTDDMFAGLPESLPAKPKVAWDTLLVATLPHEKGNTDQKKRRSELFNKLDTKRSGQLSLEDVTSGLEQEMGVSHVVKAPVAIKVAFDSTQQKKQKQKQKQKKNNNATTQEEDQEQQQDENSASSPEQKTDVVHKKEFRSLLGNLRQYFELYQLFEEIDVGDDLRIDINEFKKAAPILERWGVTVEDPAATFKAIDKTGGGQLLFDEFAEWAMLVNLEHPDNDDDDDE